MDIKEKYDSIIFDLDGTLWDSSKPICEAWNIILDKHPEILREPITIDELGGCMGLPMYDIAAKLFPLEKSAYLKTDTLKRQVGCFFQSLRKLLSG